MSYSNIITWNIKWYSLVQNKCKLLYLNLKVPWLSQVISNLIYWIVLRFKIPCNYNFTLHNYSSTQYITPARVHITIKRRYFIAMISEVSNIIWKFHVIIILFCMTMGAFWWDCWWITTELWCSVGIDTECMHWSCQFFPQTVIDETMHLKHTKISYNG